MAALTGTVSEILNEFTDRINQPREATYITGTTPAARQYVSLFKFIANQLLENPNGWAQLKRIYTFTITEGVSNYQLPGDYLRMLSGTQWGVTTQIPLAGPLSNAQLAFQTYGTNIATPFSGYQVNGAQGYIFNTTTYTQRSAGYFQISPAGQNSTDVNAIAYTSSNYLWPQNWAATTAYTIGNIRTGVNNIYYCTQNGTSGTTRLSATSGVITDGTCTWVPYFEPYPFTADTDFCLFDYELMVEGIKWAWYQSKKQDYLDLKSQWLSSVRNSLGRANSNAIVNAAYNMNYNPDFPNTPVGSWSGTGDV